MTRFSLSNGKALVLLRLPHRSPPPQGSSRSDELLSLVLAARAGDRSAKGTLISVLTPQVFRQVRRILGSAHPDVDDVTQEAVLEVMQALERFRNECTVLHFASRIAVKIAIDARRREAYRARREPELEASLSAALDEHSATPEQHAAANSALEAVRRLLDNLPAAQAEALALHFVVGLTVAEIAAAMSASFETTRSRLRLGLNALRQLVAQNENLQEALGRSG